MSEPEFDLYLSLLSKFLRLNSTQKADIAEELRVHLEDRLAELTAQGQSRDEAIRLALEEFGDAGALAWQFTLPHHLRRRRQIMRYSIGSFFAVAGIFALVSLNWPTQPDQPPRITAAMAQPAAASFTDSPDGADLDQQSLRQQLEAKLDRRDLEFNFVETSLQDGITYIGEELELDIILDSGIVSTGLFTLKARKGALSARTALELMFRQEDSNPHPTFVIKDGVLLITSSHEDYEVLVYDCRNLLLGAVVQGPGGNVSGGMMGGGGGGFFSVPAELGAAILTQFGGGAVPGNEHQVDAWASTASTSLAGAALIRVVQSATYPAPWVNIDGDGGSLTEFDGMLIVRHTQTVHRKIEELLKKLQKTKELHLAAVLKQTDSAPPLKIPAGKRLVTLTGNNWTAPASLMKPGSKIDLLIIKNQPSDNQSVTEVLVSDVEVMARSGNLMYDGSGQSTNTLSNLSLSVSVTPEEAIKVRQAEQNGSLQFLLRGDDP